MMRKAAAIICVSDPESRLVADHFPSVTDKISVIPNGVDLRRIERAAPRPRKRPFLLFVGRLEEYKQVDRVIGALPLTRGQPDLVIVGTGPEGPHLARLTEDLGVVDRVTFLHDLADEELYGLMRAAHTVVTMSTEEAFGLVLAEGLAAGACVVASDIPAHRYVKSLDDQAPVTLVPMDSGPEVLAGRLDDSLRQPRPGQPAAMPLWSEVSRRTLALYGSVIGRTTAIVWVPPHPSPAHGEPGA